MRQIWGFFIGLLLLFTSIEVIGQVKFDLSSDTVCVGDLLTITDDAQPNTYYNFKGSKFDTCGVIPNAIPYDNFVSCKSYIYKQAGTYLIDQVINSYTAQKKVIVMEKKEPEFTVTRCISNQVKIHVTDNYYHKYTIDYGIGPVSAVSGQTFIVTLPGPTNIKVTGMFNPTLCGNSGTKNVTPFAALPLPKLNKVTTTLQNSVTGAISLDVNLNPAFDLYKIERDDSYPSTFASIDTLKGTATSSNDINLNTENKSYCYRVSAFDDCNNVSSSEIICSNTFSVIPTNNLNTISWGQYYGPNFQSYEIIKNNISLTIINTNGTLSFNDVDIKCGKEDCYKLITHLTTGAISESSSICVKGISTNLPPAIDNLNSTFENNQIKIIWTSSIASIPQISLSKSNNSGPFEKLADVKQAPYFVSSPDLRASSCYHVQFSDSCGNQSPLSNTTCPIILNIEESESANTLQWNGYTGFISGTAKYVVVKTDLSGNIIKEIDNGSGLFYTDTEIDPHTAVGFNYYVKAYPNSTEIMPFSQSNTKTVKYEIQIFSPTAFTPDKDGLNDMFIPKGKFFTEYDLTVFNRWGEIVFHSEDINSGWDGTFKGNIAQPDSYAYLIKAKDNRGREKVFKGTVTLLR